MAGNSSYVEVEIEFINGDVILFDVALIGVGGQYWTYEETRFRDATNRVNGWFMAQDVNGVFHAIPITQIVQVKLNAAS